MTCDEKNIQKAGLAGVVLKGGTRRDQGQGSLIQRSVGEQPQPLQDQDTRALRVPQQDQRLHVDLAKDEPDNGGEEEAPGKGDRSVDHEFRTVMENHMYRWESRPTFSRTQC